LKTKFKRIQRDKIKSRKPLKEQIILRLKTRILKEG